MQRADVLAALKTYIVNEILDGREIGLEPSTPLLEWGIINSLEMMRLLTFIQTEFNVEVPMGQIVPDHFKDLDALTDLVLGLAAPAS